ncbi:sterol carrier protein (plasmid) [Haloferax mediterranei ATCC 33500]|uniref:Sterol carrier protein n=1 Tax=Haloferax mediterranei (strain ATCC 33500 / DSM 1411 / JCM 8866 / NBRC 14739 / NCIMB 2177 / R-4) TaxID=523841 RepID=I3R906_HALMT|nr:SCP2 sterol-binding domain-containing protein [Haloferax mediterranei]AFK20716.1 sterol carrier protein [Haloferax mediterranei ATCC 33500]AHZ24028.1 sterol carrier protein [Haloferax mediterranei ATCC 33500]ELZ97614.1 sterol carrier protein [Haloferax mediterranei ATCC 33500]MDX5989701.1 SCP2 sterol-binding domain-containing protein [Haloferax mediterranei ATCC 33500]QCQ77400.1 sterol carrier protein [Haloferax mediterranei ATCC 33500]
MTVRLPSEPEAYIKEYKRKLNASEEYSDTGEGWGVGFNGDFLYEIQPDGTYEGDPIHFFVGLEDGDCTESYVVGDPDKEDWGFAYRGGYEDWKLLMQGEIDPVEGMMDGTFDLDGDMQKVMQYSQAAVVMTECAGDVDVEFDY